MRLIHLITEQVQQTFFEDFKSWWMEKRNNDEDPIDIKFDLPHNEGDFQRSLRDAVDVGTDIFYILSKLWEMWGVDSDNEQLLNTIQDRNEFGKNLFYIMRRNDFVFDKEAKGAKTAVDRQDRDAFAKEYPEVGLNEFISNERLSQLLKEQNNIEEAIPAIAGVIGRVGGVIARAAGGIGRSMSRVSKAAKGGMKNVNKAANQLNKYGDYIDAADTISQMASSDDDDEI